MKDFFKNSAKIFFSTSAYDVLTVVYLVYQTNPQKREGVTDGKQEN
jgi:hypothetical protein